MATTVTRPQLIQEQAAAGPPFTCKLELRYGNEEAAKIVMATLAVDAELQPDKVKRSISTQDEKVIVSFSATEARFLRASLSAFFDILTLTTKTIEEFAPQLM